MMAVVVVEVAASKVLGHLHQAQFKVELVALISTVLLQ